MPYVLDPPIIHRWLKSIITISLILTVLELLLQSVILCY